MNHLLIALILGVALGFAAKDVIAAAVEAAVRAFHTAVRLAQYALMAGGVVLIIRVVA